MRASLDELRDRFVALARIPSPSGSERAVADAVAGELRALGLEVEEDDAAGQAGAGAGNLLARVPGAGPGLPVALCAHLDTVPLDGAPQVVVEGGVVRSDGRTILGADDKAAVAVLLALARDLAAAPPPCPVELVFTVAEEVGLRGAKAFDVARLGARVAFILDSEGPPGTAITGAPTLDLVTAEFRGRAAHAGIAPEEGRSAVAAAAAAVAAMRLGRIDAETTANVGVIAGGTATNVVPDRCVVRGEARSHDPDKVAAQVEHMVACCTEAAALRGVDVEVDVREDFRGYAHDPDGLPLTLAREAALAAGLEPRLVRGGGGSDANVFNARGLPAVTLGVGFEEVHSPGERIAVARLGELYRLAHALVAAAGARAA